MFSILEFCCCTLRWAGLANHCVSRCGLRVRCLSPDGPVFEDVDVEVEGAGERQSQVRQLNDHIQPQRPGLLFHFTVS